MCGTFLFTYLSRVKRMFQIASVWLLLAAFTITLLPTETFHHHEEAACETDHAHNTADACHISLYHTNEAPELTCNHDSHYDVQHTDCELCKVVLSLRSQLFVEKTASATTGIDNNIITEYCSPFTAVAVHNTTRDRAPPAC